MSRGQRGRIAAVVVGARRQAVLEFLRTNPKMTLGEAAKLPEGYGDVAKELTMAEIMSGRSRRSAGPIGHRGSPGPSEVSVRTKVERNAYDARVLEALLAHGEPMGAEALRLEVGGHGSQLRRSLKRLIGRKKVKRKGKDRNTLYWAV